MISLFGATHINADPLFSSVDLRMVCAYHAYGLVHLGRVAVLLFGVWVREGLKRDFVFETKQDRIVCTTDAAAFHIFMVRVCIIYV